MQAIPLYSESSIRTAFFVLHISNSSIFLLLNWTINFKDILHFFHVAAVPIHPPKGCEFIRVLLGFWKVWLYFELFQIFLCFLCESIFDLLILIVWWFCQIFRNSSKIGRMFFKSKMFIFANSGSDRKIFNPLPNKAQQFLEKSVGGVFY